MSDKYAALRAAAQEEIMCRESGDTSDAWQDEASPEFIIELLAERDADRARIAELEETVDLQRDKIKRIESDLWDEQQLRKVYGQKSFELENENRELKLRNDKDFVWRGEEISRLNDEVDALKEKCAAAGISLKIEGE